MKINQLLTLGIFMFLFGCSPTYTQKSLIKEQDNSKKKCVLVDENRQAIEQTVNMFCEAFSAYTKDSVIPVITKIYANDAFLNDRIHSVQGSQEIERYFTETFTKVDGAKFHIKEVTYANSNVFIQWIMELDFKNTQEDSSFLGLTVLRFNENGKIQYHQDYWDYSELLSQIKFVKSIVNYAKSKS